MEYIKGLEMFKSVPNWFNSVETLFIFLLITFVFVYYFYKINFSKSFYCLDITHYITNFLIIGFYGVILFWVSNFVLKIALIYSLILTTIFYAGSIFVLTLTLIFLRRRKVKAFCVYVAEVFNSLNIDRDKYLKIMKKDKSLKDYTLIELYNEDFPELNELILKASDADHGYTKELLKDMRNEKQIDVEKYKNINIFENKNYNPK